MTKHRTTAQQRARQMQHAPGARLSYAKALETARRAPGPEQARAALRDLTGDNAVSVSWRERIGYHLAAADESGWPSARHTAELRDDLHLLAGAVAPADDLPCVPGAFVHFPLAFLHRAVTQGQDAFAWAAAGALAGPLRHLLRHPYGQPPRLDDVVYRSRKAPTDAPRRLVTVDTPDGLHFADLPYPRPWGTQDIHGVYRTSDARGRRELARAVLAHALGSATPTSLSACRACQGNGWLTAVDTDHLEHVPVYRSDESGPVCACAGCEGTGLRPLPVQAFAEAFGRRLGAGAGSGVTRSEILTWAASRLPAEPDAAAVCGGGLQSAYVGAVVDAVRTAGFTVAGAGEEADPYELDFDVDGILGAHFYAGGERAVHLFGRERVLLFWYSDRGWTVTGFGEQRLLLPGDFVPAPKDVARALGEPAADYDEMLIGMSPCDVDAYTAVLAYQEGAGR